MPKRNIAIFSDIEYLLLATIRNNKSLLTNECTDLVGVAFNAIKFNVNQKLVALGENIIDKEFLGKDYSGSRIYKYFISG